MTTPSPSAAVACRSLTKDFGAGSYRVQALRGVELDVYPGEITLLVGPSGCGKTTLLSIIAGVLDPTDGEVRVLGRDVSRMSAREKVLFRRQNVGFIFQHFHLLPALTAVENVTVPLAIAGLSKRRAMTKAREVLAEVGLEHRAHEVPSHLSGGEQQRVAIGRALIHQPMLLLCDEPTSALDAHTGHSIMELLRDVAVRSNRAVMIVTHDNRVFDFGSRIAYMNDGRIERVESRPEARRA